MNLLLLEPEQLDDAGRATIAGAQLSHVVRVLGKGVGDTLVTGVLGGKIGTARIESLSSARAELLCALDRDPPPPLPLTLVLALPRPPMLRRLLAAVTSMGVKSIHLVHTARVDKSYWGTPSLAPDKVGEQLRLGLSQAVDTVLPLVTEHRRFRPFVEDRLPGIAAASERIVAHPEPGAPPASPVAGAITAVIGPEGGLVEFETNALAAAGFRTVGLGPRILRVETATIALIARLSGAT